VVANRRGFNAIHVGVLPPQCAALVQLSVAVEEMAVEAALTGDPTLLSRRCASTAVGRGAEPGGDQEDVQEMLLKNKPHLPQFKNVKI